jgi:hypothetical protein
MNGDAHQSSSLRRDDFSSARILANYLDHEQETRCMVAGEGRAEWNQNGACDVLSSAAMLNSSMLASEASLRLAS